MAWPARRRHGAGWAHIFPFGANPELDVGECVFTVIPDYFWHLALPLTAMVLSAFAVSTLLTKNSSSTRSASNM